MSPTCKVFEERRIFTSHMDCGGCQLRTIRMGPGPVKRCQTTIKVPATTATIFACKPSGRVR
jgi:hypothetical protein